MSLPYNAGSSITRWLYCVECPQYSIRLEAFGHLCDTSKWACPKTTSSAYCTGSPT